MTLKRSLFVLLLTPILLFSPAPAFSSINDGIIAIVNDDVITLKDLHEYLSMIYMSLTTAKVSQKEMKETMDFYEKNGLEKLIDERLKIAYADKKEIKIRPEIVEKRIQDIKKQYPSEKKFYDELMAQGMTLTDLRKKILDQFKSYYAEELEVKSKITVHPQEVTAYYQENPDQFTAPERAKVESIFIPYEVDKKLATEKAREALNIIKDPATLAQYPKGYQDVAAKFSGVSSIDTMQKGEMLPSVEAAVFKLKVNEISSLVPTEKGIYIFKILEKFPESKLSLEEAKEKIHDMLFQKKFNDRREIWLKKIRQNAYIEIK
jgi:parvulin-like peptidyl-prolyl isomerase